MSRFRIHLKVFLSCIVLVCCVHSSQIASADVHKVDYVVRITKEVPRKLVVSIQFTPTHSGTVALCIPTWSPGWYVQLKTADTIRNVQATQGTRTVIPRKSDSGEWDLPVESDQPVSVSYTVATETTGLGFFHPSLSETHAFVPGTTTLMYVKGAEQKPAVITYDVPPGWLVTSPNHPVKGRVNTFSAPTYDHLVDHPADLGDVEEAEENVDGNVLAVTVVGASKGTAQRWLTGLLRIWRAATRAFGEAPTDRYTFQLRFSDMKGFYGGLEHADSAVIRLPRSAANRTSVDDLRLCAHELIHAWIVKRVRPAGLGPFDYSQPVKTPELWFCEGVTDYLAPKLCVSAGLMNRSEYLNDVSQQLTELTNNPARLQVTAEESSVRVWEAANSQGFGGLSYYNKGYVVGLAADLAIQSETQYQRSIWDVILALLKDYRKTGASYGERGAEAAINRIGGPKTAALMTSMLRTTAEIDLSPYFSELGIVANTRHVDVTYLGITFDINHTKGDEAFVSAVLADSPAAQAGISGGMTLLDARASGLAIANKPAGTVLLLRFRTKDGAVVTYKPTLVAADYKVIRLSPKSDISALQKDRVNTLTGVGLKAKEEAVPDGHSAAGRQNVVLVHGRN